MDKYIYNLTQSEGYSDPCMNCTYKYVGVTDNCRMHRKIPIEIKTGKRSCEHYTTFGNDNIKQIGGDYETM